MSEIRVRWTQRVMGRYPGDEETVEHTPLIDGLLANNRIVLVDAAPVQVAPVHVEVSPHTNDLGQVLENVHIDLPVPEDTVANDTIPEAVSEVEFEIPKPAAPRPRAPRKE